jgi:protein-tyrosine phosphatase
MAARLVSQGKKVLVHCQAGLNRSGVVTALALINLGYTPTAAIELMREKRSPLVLCNEAFENWVLDQ